MNEIGGRCGTRTHDPADVNRRLSKASRARMRADWDRYCSQSVVDRDELARAILVAAQENDRRSIDDRFEWYGSAAEMADAIVDALADPERSDR